MAFPKLHLILIFSALFFVSCKEKDAMTVDTKSTVKEATLEQKKQALQNAAPQSTTNSTGNLALNPAHGQPGHRCDIPVGAPLNGGNSTTGPTKPINLNNTPASTSSGNGTINPPHGQPGHRCDVKVGEPL